MIYVEGGVVQGVYSQEPITYRLVDLDELDDSKGQPVRDLEADPLRDLEWLTQEIIRARAPRPVRKWASAT